MDTKSRANDVSSSSQPSVCVQITWRLVKAQIAGSNHNPPHPVFSLGHNLSLGYDSEIWISDKFPGDAGLGTTFEPVQDAQCLPKQN